MYVYPADFSLGALLLFIFLFVPGSAPDILKILVKVSLILGAASLALRAALWAFGFALRWILGRIFSLILDLFSRLRGNIPVSSNDPEKVLAKLKIASEKWGAVRINGPDEFKDICVRLAAEHGFTLKNEDLQARVEELRRARETASQAALPSPKRPKIVLRSRRRVARTSSAGQTRGENGGA